MSTSSVTSSLTNQTVPPELDKFEVGERGVLHSAYGNPIMERWFQLGLQKGVPSIRLQKASVLAPLTVPSLLRAFIHICSSSLTPELSMKVFVSSDSQKTSSSSYVPCLNMIRSTKPASVECSDLDKTYILIGRNLSQWKESLSGEIHLPDSNQVALKVQRTHQRFVSYVQDSSGIPCPEAVRSVPGSQIHEAQSNNGDHSTPATLFIPRQRLLWATVSRNQEWIMWMYNFNKDSQESLSKQCIALIQWHNARWALLSSIVAQKLGLFHNQPSANRVHAHHTLRNNPFMAPTEMEALVKFHVPPASRDYNSAMAGRKPQPHPPHLAHLEAYRDSKPARLLTHSPYGQQGDLVTRHGQQWIEKRHAERREEMQRLLVLCPARSTGSNISVTEDVIQLFKQVARIIHYCFTPLLFLPKWRLQVARTRDPNMAANPLSSEFDK